MTSEQAELPEGWKLATIGSVCDLNPAKPPKDILPANAPVTFVPMPAVDAETGTINAPVQRAFDEVRKGYTAFQNNDVLFAKITPCMENGKAAVARHLANGLGFGSTEFHVLRSKGAILPDYLFYFIRQEAFRSNAEEAMTGSVGQERVPADFIANALIPVCPIEEQVRIICQIEKLLPEVARIKERLARVSQLMKRFRQSVLAAACSGRLTADWREQSNQASAEQLKKEIFEIRQKRMGVSYKEPFAPDTRDMEVIPAGWAVLSMDAITIYITSGSRDWSQYYGRGSGTFIMAQNVRPGVLNLSYRQAVDPPENNRDRERSKVYPGDLLVTIVGANTGDVCPVLQNLQEHYICQSVALMRPAILEMTPYLNLYMNSRQHGRRFYEACFYGAGRPHLSFDQLRATPIALPSLAEQQEIVRRAEALLKLADAIEAWVEAATQRAEKLTQAILAKAFRGELVPTEAELARQEGRDYEPASELLARIQAERDGTAPTKRKSKRSPQATLPL